jgi:hypothetical protein
MEQRIVKRGPDGKRLDPRKCPGSVREDGKTIYHGSHCCMMSDDEILRFDFESTIKAYQPSRFKS